MITTVRLTLLFLSLALARVNAEEQCSQPAGNADQTGHTATDEDDRFFVLDVDHPVQCSGTVEQLNYCVYNPERDGGNRMHQAFVAVFSQTDSTDVYSRNSSFVMLSQENNDIDEDFVFACFTLDVNFVVQENDVFGVCQIDPNGRSRRLLNVVGTGGPSDTSLYVIRSSETSDNECMQTMEVNTQTGPNGQFEEGYVLHVYANINIMSTEQPTTEMPTTVATTVPTTEMPTTVETTVPTTEKPTTVEATVPTTEMPTTVDTTDPAAEMATTVEATTVETTDPPTEMPTTVETTNSTTEIPTDLTLLEPQKATGRIAGIATSVVVIAVIVIIVTVTVVIVILLRKKRKSGNVIQTRDLISENVPYTAGMAIAALDNKIYEATESNEYYEVPSSSQQQSTETDATFYEMPLKNGGTGMTFPTIYENSSTQKVGGIHSNGHNYGENNSTVYENTSFSTSHKSQPNEYYTQPSGPVAATSLSDLLMQNKSRDIYADQSPYCAPASQEDELYGQIEDFGIRKISHNKLKVMKHLGSGQFGSVDQGVWRRPNDSAVDVALKTLKEGSSEQDKVRFLQEGAIMAQFRHPNIVSLHGIVCTGGPVTLVVELVGKGDLREYLLAFPAETLPPDTAIQLLAFSQQVALGMQYLTSKGFVHRDLAARNILVSTDNICKVADFGMSRDLADENYYIAHGGKIPVKWTAPEALHFKKYSTASDVWSYGCLLYEIWSIGHKPFEDRTNSEVIQLVDCGYRLPPPPGCPQSIYELMIAAWHPEKGKRPGFRHLLLGLLKNEEEILSIPVSHNGSQALVLGAPLKEAMKLYPDLQNMYMYKR